MSFAKRCPMALGAGSVLLALSLAPPIWAMEPTPETPGDDPPVVTNEAVPAATRLIIKYVDAQDGLLQSQESASNAAEDLTEEIGVELQHIRVMAGNAQLVEVVSTQGVTATEAAQTLDAVIETLEADPRIEYVEEDSWQVIQQAVNDPRYDDQWHYTLPASGVDVEAAWSSVSGAGAVVAVIDTGFRPHADLAANLLPGYDFITNVTVANDGNGRDPDASDPGDWVLNSETWCPNRPRNSSWHGTHVAGTVAAVTNNGLGVAGVAPGARVVPVRVLGKCGGNLSDIADGIRWAAGLPVPGVPNNANPARVINMSLGGGGACGGTYQSAIDAAVAAGVTVVVSAGNTNTDASNNRPANCNGVITVASTKRDGGRAYYSAFGATVEVAAPGGETPWVAADGVLSTLNTGTQGPGADSYAFYQGTSMAAPHVAGIAALMVDANPSITPAEISATLQATAKPFPTVTTRQCTTASCGAGIVSAGAAVAAISGTQTMAMPWLKLILK